MTPPKVTLDPHAREYVYLSITAEPALAGAWEISGDDWATTVQLEEGMWTLNDVTYTWRVLAAGPLCPLPATAGQLDVARSGLRTEVRNITAPEATVRPGPTVFLT